MSRSSPRIFLPSTQSSSAACREDEPLAIDENARTGQKRKKKPKATAARKEVTTLRKYTQLHIESQGLSESPSEAGPQTMAWVSEICLLWYTDSNITDSPLPYSPRPFTPSDHPQTPPQESAPTPTPEPQQAGQKRSRTTDSEDDFDLEAWLRSDPEMTRDLEFLGETQLTKRIRASDF